MILTYLRRKSYSHLFLLGVNAMDCKQLFIEKRKEFKLNPTSLGDLEAYDNRDNTHNYTLLWVITFNRIPIRTIANNRYHTGKASFLHHLLAKKPPVDMTSGANLTPFSLWVFVFGWSFWLIMTCLGLQGELSWPGTFRDWWFICYRKPWKPRHAPIPCKMGHWG